MYSVILMTAMTTSAPEAPKCFGLFGGFGSRPVATSCRGFGGCSGGNGGCWGGCWGSRAGCWGCNGCHGYSAGCGGCTGAYTSCAGCAGMSVGYGGGYSGVVVSGGYGRILYTSPEIWAGTWSYSSTYPGQGPSYIPTTISGKSATPGRPEMKEVDDTSAKLIIDVPAGAKLYVDDRLMTGDSTVRHFHTPALRPGQSYFYEVRIEVVKAGKLVTDTKRVVVRAGDMVRESFKRIGEPAVLASTQK